MAAMEGELDAPAGESPPLDVLPRVLGRFDAVMLVVGGIIGSGVFFKARVLAGGELHSFAVIIGVWVLVGLHTLCASLSLAELAAMLPQAGGPFVYLREAYGRLVAFLWGWTEFWIVRAASLGALSCATVMSLHEVVGISRTTQEVLAVSIIIGLSAINVVRTRWGAAVANITTLIKVSFLAVLIVGPYLLGKANTENLGPIWPAAIDGTFWRALGVAMIAVLWPYDGWINVSQVAEEIREPQRNIPFAIIAGIVAIVLIYVSVNVSYHLLLPMEAIARSENGVAADASRAMFGETGAKLAALGVMCSTFGATNSNLLTGPRVFFAMARDGLMPSPLRLVHVGFQTPANAIIAQGAWSSVLVIVAFAWKPNPEDTFDALTDFVIFGGLVFYALVVAAVPVLRRKRPDLHRPYRTWGYPLTPALYIAGSSGVMLSMLFDKWEQTAAGSLLIAAGVVYYFFVTYDPRRETP